MRYLVVKIQSLIKYKYALNFLYYVFIDQKCFQKYNKLNLSTKLY